MKHFFEGLLIGIISASILGAAICIAVLFFGFPVYWAYGLFAFVIIASLLFYAISKITKK